jgi:hypothetical protein
MTPTLEVLSNHGRIVAWTNWLERHYMRGSTVRNKITHIVSLFRWCEVFQKEKLGSAEGAARSLRTLLQAAEAAKKKAVI